MIYLLIKNAQDYEEQDEIIWGSMFQSRVEAKRDKLFEGHKVLDKIKELCAKENERYTKINPPPVELDITTLPIRPLVWTGWQHQNAYLYEFRIESRKYIQKLLEHRAKFIEQVEKEYSVLIGLKKHLEYDVWAGYEINSSYSIKEVESD